MLPEKRHLLTDSALWTDANDQEVASKLLEYFDAYNSVPDAASWRLLLGDLFDEDGVDEAFSRTWEGEPLNQDFAADLLSEFRSKSKIRSAIEEVALLLQSGSGVKEIHKVLASVSSPEEEEQDSRTSWAESIEDRLREYRTERETVNVQRFRTGISAIDGVLDGGLGRSELGVILGRPNGGKTTALVNIGKAALLQGHKVVHFTLEMSNKSIARRYDMSITGLNKNSLQTKQKTAHAKLQEICRRMVNGGLEIKQYATGSATVGTLISYLDFLAHNKWEPDLVIVDYAALLGSTKNYDSYRFELSDTFRRLRGIAVDRNVGVWTAHQTNRMGAQMELITMNDLAECYDVGAIVDLIISHNQTIEEVQANVARWFIAKAREAQAMFTTHVFVDYPTCQIRDME